MDFSAATAAASGGLYNDRLYFYYQKMANMASSGMEMMTMDPGWSLVVGCLVACALLFATLPCVVSLSSKYERRQHGNGISKAAKRGGTKKKSVLKKRKKNAQLLTEYDGSYSRDHHDNGTHGHHHGSSSTSSSSSSSASEGAKEGSTTATNGNSPVTSKTRKGRSNFQQNAANKDNGSMERVESLIDLGYLEPSRSSFSAARFKRRSANDAASVSSSSQSSISLQLYSMTRIPSELPAPPPTSSRPGTVPGSATSANGVFGNQLCVPGSGLMNMNNHSQYLCPIEPFQIEDSDSDLEMGGREGKEQTAHNEEQEGEDEPPTIYIETAKARSSSSQSRASATTSASAISATNNTVYSKTQFVDWVYQGFTEACNLNNVFQALPSKTNSIKHLQLHAGKNHSHSQVDEGFANLNVADTTIKDIPLKMDDDSHNDNDDANRNDRLTESNMPFTAYLEHHGQELVRQASSSLAAFASSTFKPSESARKEKTEINGTASISQYEKDSNEMGATIPTELPKPKISRHRKSSHYKTTRRKSPKSSTVMDGASGNSSDNSVSILSPLDQDDVSFTDAIDHYRSDPNHNIGNNNGCIVMDRRRRPSLPRERCDGADDATNSTNTSASYDRREIDVLCGPRAWWKLSIWKQSIDRLIDISDLDTEMWTLIRTFVPLSSQALFTGTLQIVEIGLIGQMFGTASLTIYVVAGTLIWLPTALLVYGFPESMAKIVPEILVQLTDAKAQGKIKAEIGQYLSTTMIWIILGMIPIGLVWSYFTSSAFRWLGMSAELWSPAQSYAQVQVIVEFLTAISYTLHLFVDLVGLSKYSTWSNIIFATGQTVGVAVPIALVSESSIRNGEAIVYIAMLRTLIGLTHIITSAVIVMCTGWLDKGYLRGLLRVPFRNLAITCEVFWTALPLGVAYFFTYAHWELMSIVFARALGPAELVSWILLGYVWYLLKYTVDGLADATQIRCCHWLISNQPNMAQTSAQKSHFLGASFSMLLVSILFMAGQHLVAWMTRDVVLQSMITETFPLIGLGVIVQTVDLVSLAAVGAQQDHRIWLSQFVQFFGTWVVTVALGAVFCFALRINLQGLTSAVVLGLAISGAGQTYLLMKSDWVQVAAIMSRGLSSSLSSIVTGSGENENNPAASTMEKERDPKNRDSDSEHQIIIEEESESSSSS